MQRYKTLTELEVGDHITQAYELGDIWLPTNWVVTQVRPHSNIGVLASSLSDTSPRLLQGHIYYGFEVSDSVKTPCKPRFLIEDLVPVGDLHLGDSMCGFFDSLGWWIPVSLTVVSKSEEGVYTVYSGSNVDAYRLVGNRLCLPRSAQFANQGLAERFQSVVSSLRVVRV